MNDEIRKMIEQLRQDPKVAELLSSGRLSSLANDPQIKKAISSLENSDPQNVEQAAKDLLVSKEGEKIKQALDAAGIKL